MVAELDPDPLGGHQRVTPGGCLNWTAVGAVGELLGGLVVIATLIYLGQQVRQSNRLARAEAYRLTLHRFSEISHEWAVNGDTAELMVRVVLNGLRRDDLSPRQRAIVGFEINSMLRLCAAVYHQERLGILPESVYDVMGERVLGSPYMHDLWPILRSEFPEDFRRFMERRYSLSATSESYERLPLMAEVPRDPPQASSS